MSQRNDNQFASCLSRELILAYLSGRLEDEEINSVAQHAEDCADCLNAIDQVALVERAKLHELRPGMTVHHIKQFIKRIGDTGSVFGCDLSTLVDVVPPEDWILSTNGDDLSAARIPGTLGNYQLLELIGVGGMGVVFRARHDLLKKDFAVKVLHPNRMKSDKSRAQFLLEMEALGKLGNHPNVVMATDASECKGWHFVVMEFIDGCSVKELLYRRQSPLPLAWAAKICRDVAKGLDFIHKSELIHRDVKPSNILLSKEGNAKLTDLGLATTSQDSGDPWPLGTSLAGTADYMPPEAWCNGVTDARIDIYALGCTFFELLVGAPPFRNANESVGVIRRRHLEEDFPWHLLPNQLSENHQLCKLIGKLADKDPLRRIQSAASAADLIEQFTSDCATLPALQTLEVVSPSIVRTIGVRRRLVLAGFLSAGIAGIGFAFQKKRARIICLPRSNESVSVLPVQATHAADAHVTWQNGNVSLGAKHQMLASFGLLATSSFNIRVSFLTNQLPAELGVFYALNILPEANTKGIFSAIRLRKVGFDPKCFLDFVENVTSLEEYPYEDDERTLASALIHDELKGELILVVHVRNHELTSAELEVNGVTQTFDFKYRKVRPSQPKAYGRCGVLIGNGNSMVKDFTVIA